MGIVRDDRDVPLFCDGRLSDHTSGVEEALKKDIERYDANRLLNTPVDDLVSYFVEAHAVETVTLDEAGIHTLSPRETQVEAGKLSRDAMFMLSDPHKRIPATAYTYVIPFGGDPRTLRLTPNQWTHHYPHASIGIGDNEMRLTFITSDADPGAAIKAAFEDELRTTQTFLRTQAAQAESFNRNLASMARAAVEQRRNRLLAAQNTSAALGYPMRPREGAPTTYAPPSVRRKIRPAPPPASSAPYRAEPALPDEQYEHILSTMQHMAVVIERAPSSFEKIDEEGIRQHFLMQLNGHYQGDATGETFNAAGKTDILIRVEDKNIFIAECKFWRGPSGFTDAIDQLLGYATWRDSKTAIVVLNRGTAFSTVLDKIPETLKLHPNFKRAMPTKCETHFRAVLSHKNDPSRELITTVLAFDLPILKST